MNLLLHTLLRFTPRLEERPEVVVVDGLYTGRATRWLVSVEARRREEYLVMILGSAMNLRFIEATCGDEKRRSVRSTILIKILKIKKNIYFAFFVNLLTNFYFVRRSITNWFALPVRCPKAGFPQGVTGRLRPIGDFPSPPPCG